MAQSFRFKSKLLIVKRFLKRRKEMNAAQRGQEKSFSDRNNRGSDGGRLNEQFAKLDPATAFKSRGERASYENFPNQTVAP